MGLFDAFQDEQFRQDLKKNARDFTQSASNTAASLVTGPVDIMAWLLKQGGAKIDTPVGGSDWATNVGLMRNVDNGAPKLAGEAFGLLAPLAATKQGAAATARQLNQWGDNLAAPGLLNKQAGVIKFPEQSMDDLAKERMLRVQQMEDQYRLPNLHEAVPKDYLPSQYGKETVTIYRGVPSDIRDATIRPGDWVALDKKYAKSHGTGKTGKSKLLSVDVPSDHVGWAGTDMNEFFYVPR